MLKSFKENMNKQSEFDVNFNSVVNVHPNMDNEFQGYGNNGNAEEDENLWQSEDAGERGRGEDSFPGAGEMRNEMLNDFDKFAAKFEIENLSDGLGVKFRDYLEKRTKLSRLKTQKKEKRQKLEILKIKRKILQKKKNLFNHIKEERVSYLY